MPLPITLMAQNAKSGMELKNLSSLWKAERSLSSGGKDRLSNLDVSIEISIKSPRIEQTPATPTGAQMPRLQQRHTLQVPQAGIATLQRDMLSSSGDEGLSKNTSPTVSNRRTSMNLIRRHSRNIHSDLQLNEIPQDEDAASRAR